MNNRAAPGRSEILVVEDNEDDVILMRKALEQGKKPYRLHIVNNGGQALDFLRRNAPYSIAPSPDLILLDLNMPRKSGSEVLSEIKSDPCLMAIPVIVMTTSESDEDIRMCSERHANSYVTKPPDPGGLFEVVGNIVTDWFSTVKLPPRTQHEDI